MACGQPTEATMGQRCVIARIYKSRHSLKDAVIIVVHVEYSQCIT